MLLPDKIRMLLSDIYTLYMNLQCYCSISYSMTPALLGLKIIIATDITNGTRSSQNSDDY